MCDFFTLYVSELSPLIERFPHLGLCNHTYISVGSTIQSSYGEWQRQG